MRATIRMVMVVACFSLVACPDEKPIDLSSAKESSQPAVARGPAPPARPTMPDGELPFSLPLARDDRAPTLAMAPETVIFDHNILRKPTSSTSPYSGMTVPYVRPTSVTPVGVAARFDDSAGSIALFVNQSSSAVDTLYLLDDLKLSQVAFAVENRNGRRQLRYQFGAADANARDRLQIDVSQDEITIGEETVGGSAEIAKLIRDAVAARRAQSTIGIEARIGIRSGTTNARMVTVLDELGIAKVEAVFLVPVQDATAHSSSGYVDRSRGVPVVSIGQPNTQGDLDKAIIRRYIKRNIAKITYCYEKELVVSPDLSGTVSTQFFIQPDGKVASSSGSGLSARVASCVAGVIKNIEFPKPKGGGGVQVNYPFTFRPYGG